MPKCKECNDIGVIETGNNDLPCDCPAGDTALFNTVGVEGPVTGTKLRSILRNRSRARQVRKVKKINISTELHIKAAVKKLVRLARRRRETLVGIFNEVLLVSYPSTSEEEILRFYWTHYDFFHANFSHTRK